LWGQIGLGFKEGLALCLEFQEGIEPGLAFVAEEFLPLEGIVFEGSWEVNALFGGNPLCREGDSGALEVAGKLHFLQESRQEAGVAGVGEEDRLIGEGVSLKLIGEGCFDGEDFIAFACDEGCACQASQVATDDDQVIEVSRGGLDEA